MYKSFLGDILNSGTLQNWLIRIPVSLRNYISWMLTASDTGCLASKVSWILDAYSSTLILPRKFNSKE